MSKRKLTKEEIKAGYVAPVVTILSYGLSQADGATEADIDSVVDEIKEAFSKLDTDTPPTLDEAIQAVFKIAETSCDLTETETDDKVVEAFQTGYELISGKKNFLQAATAFLKARRAAKKD